MVRTRHRSGSPRHRASVRGSHHRADRPPGAARQAHPTTEAATGARHPPTEAVVENVLEIARRAAPVEDAPEDCSDHRAVDEARLAGPSLAVRAMVAIQRLARCSYRASSGTARRCENQPLAVCSPRWGQFARRPSSRPRRYRLPQVCVDCPAERDRFELSVPLLERERADFCHFPFSARETDKSQRSSTVLLKVARRLGRRAVCASGFPQTSSQIHHPVTSLCLCV